MNHLTAVLAVPPHPVNRVLRAFLLEDDANRIREPDRVMRGVGREKEHLPFADDDIPEVTVVDYFQHHGAFVLVEPFGRLVDVVICSGIWASDYLWHSSVGEMLWLEERSELTITVKPSL